MLPLLLLVCGLASPGQEAALTVRAPQPETALSLPARESVEEKGSHECLDEAETDSSIGERLSLPLPASYYPLLSRPRRAPASAESRVSGASAKP